MVRQLRFLKVGFLALLLAACTETVSPGANNQDSNISVVSCSVLATPSSISSGGLVSLQVSASGGAAPYTIQSSTGGSSSGMGQVSSSFSSTTTITNSFTNAGSASAVESGSVVVEDADGNVSSACTYYVTVLPAGSGGGSGVINNGGSGTTLACSLALNGSPSSTVNGVASVQLGNSVSFSVTASGGTGSGYSFGPVYPQGGSSIPVSMSSTTQGSSSIFAYSLAGIQNAYTTVSNNGAQASCSLPIFVTQPALVISGNLAAQTNSAITLSAYATGFNPSLTVQFTFKTAEPNIQIVPSGISASITASDNAFHRFNLTITASTNDGTQVSEIVTLVFSSILNCSIQIPSGIFAPGSPIPISVVDAAGDALTVTQATIPADGTYVGGTNPFNVEFRTSGPKLIQIAAFSPTRNLQCNAGTLVTQVIQVQDPLSGCSISSCNPATGVCGGPASIGAPVNFTVSPNAGAGNGPFQISLTTVGGSSAPVAPPSGMTQELEFNAAGSFQVLASMTDALGTQVSCSMTQAVVDVPKPTLVSVNFDGGSAWDNDCLYITDAANQTVLVGCNEGSSCHNITINMYPYSPNTFGFYLTNNGNFAHGTAGNSQIGSPGQMSYMEFSKTGSSLYVVMNDNNDTSPNDYGNVKGFQDVSFTLGFPSSNYTVQNSGLQCQ